MHPCIWCDSYQVSEKYLNGTERHGSIRTCKEQLRANNEKTGSRKSEMYGGAHLQTRVKMLVHYTVQWSAIGPLKGRPIGCIIYI